jgi:hypothetical protein
MTTAGAPTLARNKCAGTCSNQSTDGSATAAAGYSTDESTAERTATYLRRGRLRQNQEDNHRHKSDCRSVNHSFSPIIHEHKKRTVGRAWPTALVDLLYAPSGAICSSVHRRRWWLPS